ncbi:MAG: peptidylprolyl isomerase [Candidatus Taylorbacteria bacterium]
MNTTKWIWGIVVSIALLALIHWYTVSRPTSYFNEYGKDLVANDTAKAEALAKELVNATSSDASGSASATAPVSNTTNTNTTKNFMHTVTLETTKGTIVFETYDADAPKTVENFITLANKGFYNGLIFHRVIPGFMIQGGDPTGTGMGGPGYQFADELNPATPSYKAGYVRGTVAMANSGPNTNGSQFFIMQSNNGLPNSYSIFGKVISGMEVVDAIANAQRNPSDKPLVDIKMTKVTASSK